MVAENEQGRGQGGPPQGAGEFIGGLKVRKKVRRLDGIRDKEFAIELEKAGEIIEDPAVVEFAEDVQRFLLDGEGDISDFFKKYPEHQDLTFEELAPYLGVTMRPTVTLPEDQLFLAFSEKPVRMMTVAPDIEGAVEEPEIEEEVIAGLPLEELRVEEYIIKETPIVEEVQEDFEVPGNAQELLESTYPRIKEIFSGENSDDYWQEYPVGSGDYFISLNEIRKLVVSKTKGRERSDASILTLLSQTINPKFKEQTGEDIGQIVPALHGARIYIPRKQVVEVLWYLHQRLGKRGHGPSYELDKEPLFPDEERIKKKVPADKLPRPIIEEPRVIEEPVDKERPVLTIETLFSDDKQWVVEGEERFLEWSKMESLLVSKNKGERLSEVVEGAILRGHWKKWIRTCQVKPGRRLPGKGDAEFLTEKEASKFAEYISTQVARMGKGLSYTIMPTPDKLEELRASIAEAA